MCAMCVLCVYVCVYVCVCKEESNEPRIGDVRACVYCMCVCVCVCGVCVCVCVCVFE